MLPKTKIQIHKKKCTNQTLQYHIRMQGNLSGHVSNTTIMYIKIRLHYLADIFLNISFYYPLCRASFIFLNSCEHYILQAFKDKVSPRDFT